MLEQLDALVHSYDRGCLSRRQLLQALAVIAAPAAAGAQTEGPVAAGRNLHHINLQVSDLERSEVFYRRLFGFRPTRVVQGPDNHGFDLPGGGIVILQRSDSPGRIDHFCIGVDGFEADRMRAAAREAGMEPQGSASDNFFVRDPDNIRVQISDASWVA